MAAPRKEVQWSPSVRADKSAVPSGAADSFSGATTAYLRASMVAAPEGLEEALESSTLAVEEQHSAATEAAAVSDMLTRGCRTTSLNATLVDAEMRRVASAEAALAVDLVDDPALMRKLTLSSWTAVEFAEEGSLGIAFAAATEDTPLKVQSVVPGGLAARADPAVVPEMTLEAVQPPRVLGCH
jgi:hypothetical protein